MKLSLRNGVILATGMAIGIALAIGQGVLAEREDTSMPLPLNELRTFSEVFADIKSSYVEPVDDKELLENAIQGMLSGLDPHSAYLDARDYEDLKVGTTGEFGGLGIEVSLQADGFVEVIAPIDDTPAQRAGIKAGDLIIRLDDTPVKGLTLREAVDIMRGKPGSSILLTVVRKDEDKPLKISIVRDIIKVKSVKAQMLEDGYGYVRISQFQANSGTNMIAAIDDLKDQGGGSLKGLILDLRNNPGGVLNAAVEVSDAFLDKGLIVYTKGRTSDSDIKFNATPPDILNGVPMIVLINVGSASASEIVAGALQDQKRAIIMGSRSFGKGSVQTVMPLKDGNALKLTTALYYTPSGRSIQAEGIKPDISLENIQLSSAAKPEFSPLTEASLSGHLDNADKAKMEEKKTDTNKEGEDGKKESAEDIVKGDYQLYEALTLLKGLHILQQ